MAATCAGRLPPPFWFKRPLFVPVLFFSEFSDAIPGDLACSTAEEVTPDCAAENGSEKQGRRAQFIDLKVESAVPSSCSMCKFFAGIFYFPIHTMLKWLSFSKFFRTVPDQQTGTAKYGRY